MSPTAHQQIRGSSPRKAARETFPATGGGVIFYPTLNLWKIFKFFVVNTTFISFSEVKIKYITCDAVIHIHDKKKKKKKKKKWNFLFII